MRGSPIYGKREEKLLDGNQERAWHLDCTSSQESQLVEVENLEIPIELPAGSGTPWKVFACPSVKACSMVPNSLSKVFHIWLMTNKGILRMAFKTVAWISSLLSCCTLLL